MAGTGVGKFSSTAGSNTDNLTVNFAENMAPSNVNNAARELMGHIRDMYEQLGDGYFEFGDGDKEYTIARVDADTLTIATAADLSTTYFAGRKIRVTDGGANVVEGTIASTSHGSSLQTVNLTGISLASGTPTKVEIGIDTAAFGGKLILDDDGDTFIEAPTDDTIDIHIAGAKDFVFTANTFTAESGSTIAAQALTATSITSTGNIIIPNAGNIGSAGDTDSIAIASDGVVTLTQKLIGTELDISGNADVDGTTNLDVVDIDGAVDMASTLQVDGAITGSSTVVATSFNGIPFFSADSSIYTHNVSGTDDTAEGNVAYGIQALDAITTGDFNTALGYQALSAQTEGQGNVAVGQAALLANTTAGDNLAVGKSALLANTTGTRNIAVGNRTNDLADTENDNVAIGYEAMTGAVAGGESNTAIGNFTLDALTSGDDNVAIGYNAGTAITTGSFNTLVGRCAGEDMVDQRLTAVGYFAGSNTTGNLNNFFGFNCGSGNTTGASNVAMGYNAYYQPDTETFNLAIGNDALGGPIAGGEYNVAIGNLTLDALTSADDCTAVGYNAGTTITTGARNTFIGSDAGNTVSSGTDNTIVGENAQTGHTGADQQTIIGRGAAGSSTQDQIVIGYNTASTGNGYVTLGTGSGTERVYNLYTTNATWTHASDERIKKDITTNTDCGLDFINELRTVKYRKKNYSEVDANLTIYDAEDTEPKDDIIYGLIAQEVKAAMDKYNITDFDGWNKLDKEASPDEIQGISEQMFVFPLIKAVQELSATVTTLKQEINTLKGE